MIMRKCADDRQYYTRPECSCCWQMGHSVVRAEYISQNKHNRTLNCIIINFQSLAIFYGLKVWHVTSAIIWAPSLQIRRYLKSLIKIKLHISSVQLGLSHLSIVLKVKINYPLYLFRILQNQKCFCLCSGSKEISFLHYSH